MQRLLHRCRAKTRNSLYKRRTARAGYLHTRPLFALLKMLIRGFNGRCRQTRLYVSIPRSGYSESRREDQ